MWGWESDVRSKNIRRRRKKSRKRGGNGTAIITSSSTWGKGESFGTDLRANSGAGGKKKKNARFCKGAGIPRLVISEAR